MLMTKTEPIYRLIYRAALDNAISRGFHRTDLGRLDGALGVNGLTQGIDNASQQILTYGDGYDTTGSADSVAFLDILTAAEHNSRDAVLFQAECHCIHSAFKLQQLVRHTLIKTVQAGNTIADLDNCTDIIHIDLGAIVLDLFLDHGTDFFRTQLHCLTNFLLY